MKSFSRLLMAVCLAEGISATTDAQSWNLAGNSDATATSFLGTTNRQPLVIKTDNITRATFNAGGNSHV